MLATLRLLRLCLRLRQAFARLFRLGTLGLPVIFVVRVVKLILDALRLLRLRGGLRQEFAMLSRLERVPRCHFSAVVLIVGLRLALDILDARLGLFGGSRRRVLFLRESQVKRLNVRVPREPSRNLIKGILLVQVLGVRCSCREVWGRTYGVISTFDCTGVVLGMVLLRISYCSSHVSIKIIVSFEWGICDDGDSSHREGVK
ncbi:hypothetical protein F4806DRAFT_444797 [Annulohypoxylon nitens]|nr:hypothetical protein F4806DRAFT_444797 [Annulohypoxylon nitens]